MTTRNKTVNLQHKLLGPCQLVRTEGVLWVVKHLATNIEYRIPPTRRAEFSTIANTSDSKRSVANLPSVSGSLSEDVTEPKAAATPLMPSRSVVLERSVPSTPDEVLATAPAVWSQLEAWIRNDVSLDERHIVFCRRILMSQNARLRVSTKEAQDAGRLMSYAMRRGFRPQPAAEGPASPPLELNLDAASAARVSASTWSAVKAWADEADVFKPEVREFCAILANVKQRGNEIPLRHYETAARILNRSLELGFSPVRVHLEPAVESTRSTDRESLSNTVETEAASPTAVAARAGSPAPSVVDMDPRLLRRAIQSLRTGLPPTCMSERPFTVGFDEISKMIEHFLGETDEHGSAVVIRGAYGQGKTFTLGLVEELALEQGFAVARTEVDATENKLDKPQHIYRTLMANLRLPGRQAPGGKTLAEAAYECVCNIASEETNVCQRAIARRASLLTKLECEPLAWLLSDPSFMSKPRLQALLTGEKVGTIGQARSVHVLPGKARDWPTFFAGTQGDVGSYLLSGVGVLCRLLGFKGLIIILDEMEKWQDLDWKAQSRAGNLLGGLIWGATAQEGQRECRKGKGDFYRQGSVWSCCDHPAALEHSGWCGGFPFTTLRPCHIGVAIAMTPRGAGGPEHAWHRFGSLDVFDLPQFDKQALKDYMQKIRPLYEWAYDLQPMPARLSEAAYRRWRDSGDHSARSGITSLIAAMDDWRDGGGGS